MFMDWLLVMARQNKYFREEKSLYIRLDSFCLVNKAISQLDT
jgi:hypothetical protein